jgi:hypothetical protein
MRIVQLYSNFGIGFSDAIKKKYDFTDYVDSRQPVFMFGCYGERQIHYALSVARTSPMVVICWGGSDAKILKELELGTDKARTFWSNAMRNMHNIKHIAISHWIAEDMEILKFPYHRISIIPHDNSDIKPCPQGEAIYMYRPDLEAYNGGIYQKVKEKLPYRFIETNSHTFTREQLYDAYRDSFIGLRFTEHDGLSNTVCELGLMGRRVIHNGDTPNSIHYDKNNIDSIVAAVHKEYNNRNEAAYIPDEVKNYECIAQRVKEFLNIGTDWLNTEYYD